MAMKPNEYCFLDVDTINKITSPVGAISDLLLKDVWKTLDIDYYPPRVERLYTDYAGYRIYLHTIHKTDKECLFHKHRWPSVIKLLKGSYEMGLTYSEDELDTKEAHKLPILSKLILTDGSSYEMTQTDALHYVKPISKVSYSVMLTKYLYPEAEFRKEALNIELKELTKERKTELLAIFKLLIG